MFCKIFKRAPIAQQSNVMLYVQINSKKQNTAGFCLLPIVVCKTNIENYWNFDVKLLK